MPDQTQFSVGDVVRLKSGGPAMTVTYLTDNGKLERHWFDEASGQAPRLAR